MIYIRIEFKWGKSIVGFNKDGELLGLWFEHQKHYPNIAEDAIWLNSNVSENSAQYVEVYKTLNALKEQMDLYNSGELKKFDLKLAPKGTDFQKLVWKMLYRISYGETVTYGEVSRLVAKEMGRQTMSAQAVGSAVGRNPISIIIPCHRVLGSNGSLTGYAGGLDKKRALLLHEGIHLKTS